MSPSSADLAIARFTATGALDRTFGGDGRVTVRFGAGTDGAWRVALDSRGRVVIAGWAEDTVSGSNDTAVVVLRPDGRRDRRFGDEGKLAIDVVDDQDDWANGLALRPDDRIVLVRQYRHGTDRVSLEIPGGIVDEGESPADAAKYGRLVASTFLEGTSSYTTTIRLEDADYAWVDISGQPAVRLAFHAGPADSGAAEPETDASVSLRDYRFAMPTRLARGKQTLKVTNDGDEVHHALLFPLAVSNATTSRGSVSMITRCGESRNLAKLRR